MREVLLTFMLLGAASAAYAQTPAASAVVTNAGSIAGAVLDPEGKAVVTATVLVRNDATSDLKTVMTDSNGRFQVSGLPAGAYTLEVAVPGFDLVQRSGVK